MLVRRRLDRGSLDNDAARDPYRGVILFLGAGLLFGAGAAFVGGRVLGIDVLLEIAVTVLLAAGMFLGTSVAQAQRRKPLTAADDSAIDQTPAGDGAASAPAPASHNVNELSDADLLRATSVIGGAQVRFEHWLRALSVLDRVRLGIAIVATAALAGVLSHHSAASVKPIPAGIAAGLALVAAGLAATAARYLDQLAPEQLPESGGLARWSRLTAWLLVVAVVSVGLAWFGQQTILAIVNAALGILNLAICYGLLTASRAAPDAPPAFPVDLGAVSMLGSRGNILASVLDSGERQLGIDLRSTWALTVVRNGLEPLAIGLLLIGWLSTSVTVIGVEEQGLVERLGVPVGGPPLMPGLRAHWPWPFDRVYRIPVQRMQSLEVGHEGQEKPGPENVLWSVEHAPNEFTLLLGNGRDLITVDAGVQYLIVDPHAWRYHCQNPAVAMSALAYRAVMRNTVNRTLADALSENIAALTEQMRAMVQTDADSLGLGVKVVGFTVGGMHPPVPVAGAYEAVISAQIQKVTAVINARAYVNQTLPAAKAAVVVGGNRARSAGAVALGEAAGEAWSFRTLEAQYQAEPQDYMFRRRLETLEQGLAGKPFIVVDARFLRDGGELWINP